MQRRDVNPWKWSELVGFTQAVELTGIDRLMVFSGQTAIGDDGRPPTTTDMREQVRMAIDNLSAVLQHVGLSLADVVKLTVYTTHIDELFPDWSPVADAFAPNVPAATLVGVTRLVYPELKVEIEAVAARQEVATSTIRDLPNTEPGDEDWRFAATLARKTGVSLLGVPERSGSRPHPCDGGSWWRAPGGDAMKQRLSRSCEAGRQSY